MANYRTDFLDYIKEGENAALLKGSKGAELLHESPEGGTPTFGYGYKLSEKEWKEKKIGGVPIEKLTLKDAEKLLQQSLVSKETKLKERLKKGWKDPDTKQIIKVDYDSLNEKQKEMLLDYEYNLKGGISKFPSFVAGVLTNDYDRIQEEYQRGYTTNSGDFKPLKERNKLFSQRYLDKKNTNPPISNTPYPEVSSRYAGQTQSKAPGLDVASQEDLENPFFSVKKWFDSL